VIRYQIENFGGLATTEVEIALTSSRFEEYEKDLVSGAPVIAPRQNNWEMVGDDTPRQQGDPQSEKQVVKPIKRRKINLEEDDD
jgi:hypothetical protein